MIRRVCGRLTHPRSKLFANALPNGNVKIEREVTTDADGNYVNHGAWRMWDDAGKLVAEGRYEMGRRSGQWTRWWDRDESPLLGERAVRRV